MSTNLMTKAEYARHRNISKPTVSKLIKNGRLLVTEDGLIDADISDIIMEEFTRSSDDELTNDPMSYAMKRAELTGYKAELAKIDVEKARKRYVDADVIDKEAFERGRRTRDSVLSVPDRIDAVLAAESDRKKVNSILKAELESALEEVSNDTNTNIIH